MAMPKWLKVVIESVCHSCVGEDRERTTGFSLRWSKPSANSWGVWLVDLAPEPVELVGGADDGDEVFDLVDVDLLAMPHALDSAEVFAYQSASPREPAHFLLAGIQAGRELTVRLWLEPFADDEPTLVYDVCARRWRPKRR